MEDVFIDIAGYMIPDYNHAWIMKKFLMAVLTFVRIAYTIIVGAVASFEAFVRSAWLNKN